MTKTASRSPARDSGWWGSPVSVALGVLLGGLGGASVYWVAERSRAHDVVGAAQAPIFTVSPVEEPAPAAPPASAEKKAVDEPPPATVEAAPAAEAKPKESLPTAAATKEEEKEPASAKADSEKTDEPEAADSESPSDGPKSKTSAEKAMLQAARSKFRSGDKFGAQMVLEQMRQRFPQGAFAQQRELLYIQTQKALGALPAAKRSARAFAQAYPNSPYLGSLESLLLQP